MKFYNTHTEQREWFWRHWFIKWHYHYMRERKKYVWRAMQTEGGEFATPKLCKSKAVEFIAKTGARVIGVDELNKIIFFRPPR